MEWKRKVQKLGRVQVPTSYMKSKGIREGDVVTIEEKDKGLLLRFRKRR